jgi:hypothetical protein
LQKIRLFYQTSENITNGIYSSHKQVNNNKKRNYHSNVFVAQTQGMTLQQINQNRATIEAAMVQEINNQGPSNVSRHCADPNQRCVVDVGSTAFNANNGPLFYNYVCGRLTQSYDEHTTNKCYHLELAL